ncbi:MAG: hypothetical protein ACP5E5_03475 [Acidobacteriaceae bacterium]
MPEELVIEKFVFKRVLQGIGILLLLATILYPLDWAVWRLRVARGGGMGSVVVRTYTVGDLKGGKMDYFPEGASTQPCTLSLYPQEGNNPCWWVTRHREVVRRY